MARTHRRLRRGPATVDDLLAEGVLIAGGGRALLLQLAHPAIAQGVAEHSGFESGPTRRLAGTLEYVYVIAFGSEEEVRRIAREVGAAHRAVRSDGPIAYDARDPDLQLWVAATLYETTVAVIETVYGPLDPRIADELYRRGAYAGTALGMPARAWPEDREAFQEYWDGQLESLTVTPVARGLAHALMRPSAGPRWMYASMPIVRLATAGLMPERLRSAYGLRWDDRLQRRFDRLVSSAGLIYRLLPRPVRVLPSRLLLRRFRARAAPRAH